MSKLILLKINLHYTELFYNEVKLVKKIYFKNTKKNKYRNGT